MAEITDNNIKKIYKKYFNIIDSYFGAIKHYLGDEEDSHINLGSKISNYPLISDLIIDAIGNLDSEIENFWIDNAKKVLDFIKEQETLKCVYSGDISPVILENFVKRSALYVDSIIIPDPIYNLTIFQNQKILDNKYYLDKIVRHVFNIWKMKDLVLANSNENILFILPINLNLIKQDKRESLLENAEDKFTIYINQLTNNNLNNTEESLEYLQELETTDKIFKDIHNKKLLPSYYRDFDILNKFLEDFSGLNTKVEYWNNKSMGWSFGFYIRSQFIRVQEHKYFCNKLIAEPIYDYEVPWFFFNYEMGCGGIDEAIINSLQKDEFKWINKIPISALKIFREENKLDYMRNVLRKSITDLKAKNDTDLIKISQQVEDNLSDAFEQQAAEMESLEKDVKEITNKELPITTAASLAGFIPYLGNVISMATAGKDIKNIIEQKNELQKNLENKNNNFINLLFKAKEGE